MRPRIRLFGWQLLACALAGGIRPADAAATTTDTFPVAVATPRNDLDKMPAASYRVAAIDRYLPIVSRMPFGVPPPPAPPAAGPAPTELASDIGRSCILSVFARSPTGEILVGFTDNVAKPPRNLLLAVGEEAEGYTVLAADFDRETATLAKDGVRFELRLNAGPRAPPAVMPAGPVDLGGPRLGSMRLSAASWTQPNAAGAAGTAAAPRPAAESPDDLELSRNSNSSSSAQEDYAARVRARRERLVKLNAETQLQREQLAATRQQAAASEAAARVQREASLNLIRKGLKPLEPIALTPEEDAKLVSEGVLPAQ